jgi:hypothetical protein
MPENVSERQTASEPNADKMLFNRVYTIILNFFLSFYYGEETNSRL